MALGRRNRRRFIKLILTYFEQRRAVLNFDIFFTLFHLILMSRYPWKFNVDAHVAQGTISREHPNLAYNAAVNTNRALSSIVISCMPLYGLTNTSLGCNENRSLEH